MPAAALIVAAAIPLTLPPVDTCTGDPVFTAFRNSLARAVERRDPDALLAHADDGVRLSFGGRGGRDEFARSLRSATEAPNSLWGALDEVLRLGCAAKGEARVFPSMFAQADGLDGFETWIALPGARLRARPSLKGRIIGRLRWHVLSLAGDWRGQGWVPVKLADGRRGWVSETAARKPIDYRLIVNRRDGAWRITAFIAGD